MSANLNSAEKIVGACIALLIGVWAYRQLAWPTPPSRLDTAKLWVSTVGVKSLVRFRKDVGRYPSDDEGFLALLHPLRKDAARWNGPYLEGATIPKDPWGHEYRLRESMGEIEALSLGADGVISTDDIVARPK